MMKRLAHCTAYLPDGVTVCDKLDLCTRVTIRGLNGQTHIVRTVCSECRTRMKLPDRDVVFTPDSKMSTVMAKLRRLLGVNLAKLTSANRTGDGASKMSDSNH